MDRRSIGPGRRRGALRRGGVDRLDAAGPAGRRRADRELAARGIPTVGGTRRRPCAAFVRFVQATGIRSRLREIAAVAGEAGTARGALDWLARRGESLRRCSGTPACRSRMAPSWISTTRAGASTSPHESSAGRWC